MPARLGQFIEDFMPMSRVGTAQDVANVTEFFFFARGRSSFISGRQLLFSGEA